MWGLIKNAVKSVWETVTRPILLVFGTATTTVGVSRSNYPSDLYLASMTFVSNMTVIWGLILAAKLSIYLAKQALAAISPPKPVPPEAEPAPAPESTAQQQKQRMRELKEAHLKLQIENETLLRDQRLAQQRSLVQLPVPQLKNPPATTPLVDNGPTRRIAST